MVLEKVQLPVYSDYILKEWKIPITRPIQIERKDRFDNISRGISIEPEFDELGKQLSETEYIKTISENKIYFGVKAEYMTLINDFRETPTDQFIGGMPIQLEKDCLSPLLKRNLKNQFDYYMTLKVDGVRHLMFLSKTGIVYFIDRVTNIFYFKRDDSTLVSYNPTDLLFLFDGELVFHEETQRWEYLIFDVLFYPDQGAVRNFMPYSYYLRYNIIENAVRNIQNPDFDISAKLWFPIEFILPSQRPLLKNGNVDMRPIYQYVVTKTNEARGKKPKLNEDGLILQSFDGSYVPFHEWNVYNNIQFKWKPPSELTVDFKIKEDPDHKKVWWLLTASGQNYDVKLPNGQNIHAIVIPSDSDREKYKDGDVVECKLKGGPANPQKNIFVILNKREDKDRGNSLQTIMSTMGVVNQPFTLDILKPAIEAYFTLNSIGEILKFYSKSKLLLCASDMFFNTDEVSEIKKIYNIYIGNVSSFGGGGASRLQNVPPSRKIQKPKKQEKVFSTNYELELRVFPYIKKGRKENINKFTYFYLFDFLKKAIVGRGYIFTNDFMSNMEGSAYRSSYNGRTLLNPVNMKKTKVKEYTATPANPDEKLFNNLTFKLSLSTEDPSPITITVKPESSKVIAYDIIREKQRSSFYPLFDGEYLWRIDLTRVLTIKDHNKLDEGIETYELECEYIGGQIPFQTFIDSMNYVYKMILYNTSYC